MSAIVYCEHGDLPIETCACPKCRPDVRAAHLDAGLVAPGRGALLDEPTFETGVRLIEAYTHSVCEPCGLNIRPGSMIARTADGEYVCSGCAA